MKNGIIVRSGVLGLRLIGSPLYLEDEALTGRVKLGDGSSFALGEDSGPAQSFPAIHFFSVPNHLFEQLWLEEIPKLTGVVAAQPEPGRHGREWRSLDMLSVLLETIDSGFGKPVEAIFQSSTQTADGPGDAKRDICDHAAQSAQDAPEPGGWRFGAWLNLDDYSHHARVRICEPENDNGRTEEAIELEIGQGEGILWRHGQLQLTETGTSANETSNKLVLLGGKT